MVNAELGTTWCEKLSIVAMKKHALMKKQINEKIYLTVAILKKTILAKTGKRHRFLYAVRKQYTQ